MQTCNIWPAGKSPNGPVEVSSPENHRSEWVLFLAMFDNTGGYSVSAHGCDQSRISSIYNFSSYFDPPSTSNHGVWYSHCFGTFTHFYGYLKVLDSSKHPQHTQEELLAFCSKDRATEVTEKRPLKDRHPTVRLPNSISCGRAKERKRMEKLHASVGGSKTLPLKISSNETINKILDLKSKRTDFPSEELFKVKLS